MYWRLGYAAEMAGEMIGFGFRSGGRTFTASAAKENAASNAVLHKLGFHVVREGGFRKRGTDIVYPEYVYQLNPEK